MNRLQTFFSNTALLFQKFFLLGAVVLIIAFTGLQQIKYGNRPLQIQELAGREMSTDKMADVFIRMDELALRQHYLFVWTFNGIIFLSTFLLLKALGAAPRK